MKSKIIKVALKPKTDLFRIINKQIMDKITILRKRLNLFSERRGSSTFEESVISPIKEGFN